MSGNIYLDGMMGLVVGDAVGVPYEFSSREKMTHDPAVDMTGHGTYDMPAGTWSDDSSMALASLDALRSGYDPERIMENFSEWKNSGAFTPFGEVFDIGNTCMMAITNYNITPDIHTCGCGRENDNGNGSLMRILPVCLYFYEKEKAGLMTSAEIIERIHEASALTHAHLRSKLACGLYYFLVSEMADGSGSIKERLQKGFDRGFGFYAADKYAAELSYYEELRDIPQFAALPDSDIQSSGYVVTSLEAAVWCLANTDDYRSCILRAVNLGRDTDTVAAIAGGLAGLYYGYEGIPSSWLDQIAEREWIEQMCRDM